MSAASPPCLELRLRHNYYADEVCRDFELQPSLNTRRCMDGARWLFKSRPDGFTIIGTRPFVERLDQPLLFFLRLRNPEFSFFTEPKTLTNTVAPVRATLLFKPTNAGTQLVDSKVDIIPPRKPSEEPSIQLTGSPGGQVGAAGDAAEALLLADLHAMIELPAEAMKRFSTEPAIIRFERLKVVWVYEIEGSTPVKIRDYEAGVMAKEPLFKPVTSMKGVDVEPIEFSKEDTPSGRIFTSTRSLPCFERPRRNLVLCEDSPAGRELLSLPNPPLRSLNTSGAVPTLRQVIRSSALRRFA